MEMNFDLAVPSSIRFGSGRVTELTTALVELGVSRALVVTGRSTGRATASRRAMAEAGIDSEAFSIAAEPSVDVVRQGVAAARRFGSDGIVGLGGGSALDGAKAVALLARTAADPLDHLEVVGRGRPIDQPGLPCVAVPTTAGTGSEVTRNAVLSEGAVKASLRSPHMLPRVAIVDPDLLVGLPRHVIAYGGMDALTQLIEPFLSRRASPVTDALAREGLRRSARGLLGASSGGFEGAEAASVREDLALASHLSGLCLANAGLGIVHGIASVVGGRYHIPHGAICAALVGPATAVNVRAMQKRAPDHPALMKADELGRLLTGDPAADAEDGLRWLSDMRRALAVPGLNPDVTSRAEADGLLDAVNRASSSRANPIDLTGDEILTILDMAH